LPLWAANAGVAIVAAAIAAAKISFETFAMISFSASEQRKTMFCYRRAEDWITSPQIPSGLLEHNGELHCMRSAEDRGEHRETAGAFAQVLSRLSASGAWLPDAVPVTMGTD
jgi:hypothetical protein